MRWKTRPKRIIRIEVNKPIYKAPIIGDTKEEIKFAFLPVRLNDEDVVWLEKYVKIMEYGPVLCKNYLYPEAPDYIGKHLYEWSEYNDWKFKELKLYGTDKN